MGFSTRNGVVRFWQDWPEGEHKTSAHYLDTEIHGQIMKTYYNNLNQDKIKDEIANAEFLTNFFRTIKANMNNTSYADSLFQGDLVYQLFLQILKTSVSWSGNENKIKSFFNTPEKNGAKKAIGLEKEISHIQRAINVLCNKATINDLSDTKNGYRSFKKDVQGEYHSTIRFGGKSTFNAQELNNFINTRSAQYALNVCGLGTQQYYQSQDKNGNNIRWLGLAYQDKFIKIDSAFSEMNIDIEKRFGITSEMQRVLDLLSQATFSLKNYMSVFTGSKMVHVGETDITKVLLSILPTLACISQMEDAEFKSFITALFLRYFCKKGKTRSSNAIAQQHETMSKHLFHIQTVYELTGIGQHSRTNDENELNEYLKQGVKYLLVNQHNGGDMKNGLGDIKVFSTKALLMYLYRDRLDDGTIPNYGGLDEETIKTARYVRVAGFQNDNNHFAHLFDY